MEASLRVPRAFVVSDRCYTGAPKHACASCGHLLAARIELPVVEGSPTTAHARCRLCLVHFQQIVPKYALYRRAGACFKDFSCRCSRCGIRMCVRGCWGNSPAPAKAAARAREAASLAQPIDRLSLTFGVLLKQAEMDEEEVQVVAELSLDDVLRERRAVAEREGRVITLE